MKLPTITQDAIAMNLVATEIGRARVRHKDYNSCHEAYAVILEELDEFWDEVKKKSAHRNREAMRTELVQIATTAMRAIVDLDLCPDSSEI